MQRSLLFVTGTRADFGKIEPLALAAISAGFKVTFFVTGMHMMERYGLTKIEVARVKNATCVEFINQRNNDPQDVILAKTVIGFSDFVTENKPDLVIVHGDRVEALAATIVCATNYIRCAHVEGGEVSGTIDEMFRHCNTKLSLYHFVSSQVAARRLRSLGEAEEAIHVIGSPELDFHAGPSGVTLQEVKTRYKIPFDEYAIATFHPVTSEQDTIGAQARALFDALSTSEKNFVVILPNNDPGTEDILAAIEPLDSNRFRILPSMRFAHFSELMKNAAAIIGNSSAGVREAPFLGIASLDIGLRQNHRAEAASITHADALDREGILRFIRQEWAKSYPKDNSFGVGQAAQKFVDAISDDAFWAKPMQKYFSDHG